VIAVDTNILVYAANAASPFHRPCLSWIERQRVSSEPWYATWPILYEFLRVVTHPRTLQRPWTIRAAWGFLADGLLGAPTFSVLQATERHALVASETLAENADLRGNILHDAHTAILMREHGVKRICTRDTDFHRFKFLSVIDPVQL
jgi:toxin-antitoxin system PIN domain toxin